MAEQYRPINQYVENMLDPEELQMQDLRDEEVDFTRYDDYESLADIEAGNEMAQRFISNPELFVRANNVFESAANVQRALRDPMLTWDQNESIATQEYTWDILNEASDQTQWWQYMLNHADHIKSDTYKAEKKRAEVEKEKLEEERDKELSKPEESRDLEILKRLDSEIRSTEKDIENSIEDLEDIQKDIAGRNQVSLSYKLRAQAGLSDEATNILDYWGSPESAEDIGGAMSDRNLLAIQTGGGLAAAGLGAAAVFLGSNPLGWAALAVGVASTVGPLVPMRDNESKAEMFGAYEERMRMLEENYATEYGKNASGADLKKLEEDAWKGAEAVYAKNMTLVAGDILQIGAAFVPIFNVFKPFAGTATNFFAKAARTLGNVGVKYGAAFGINSIIEGFEEAYQYDIKERYKYGYLDDLDSENGWNQAWKGSMGIAGEAAGGMLGMFSHRHAGRTNTKEFRNAVRAGAVLGLGLGAASTIATGVGSKTYKNYLSRNYGEDISEINPFFENYAQADQFNARAEFFYNIFQKDKGKRAGRALRLLDRYKDAFNIDPDTDTKQMLQDYQEAINALEGLESEELTNEFTPQEKQSILKTLMIGKYQSKLNKEMAEEFQNTIEEFENNSEVNDLCK